MKDLEVLQEKQEQERREDWTVGMPTTVGDAPLIATESIQTPAAAAADPLVEQQKEEIIKSEIEDGIKRLGKRTPVSLTTMMGPNLHIIFAGSRAEFAKKVNQKVVGTCCLNGREACAELRHNLLGDNLSPVFSTRFDNKNCFICFPNRLPSQNLIVLFLPSPASSRT